MAPRTLANDRYRLQEPIGQGGMGTVWQAEDLTLHRTVAVKEVKVSPDLEPDVRAELMARTLREARICAGLSHPSIVTIHDVVEEGGRPWIVMELVRGQRLDKVIADNGPMPPRQVAEIGRQLLSALGTAHEHGVLHRDVKPANVLVLPDGRPVLSDFGIAVSDAEDRLTLTGKLPGSPGFVAPERLATGEMTQASDVWSLGATLYFAVEGRPAYDRKNLVELLNAPLTDFPDATVLAGPLRPVLYGMLQHDVEERLTGAALDSALAKVIANTTGPDPTPTQLDVSDMRMSRPQGPQGAQGPQAHRGHQSPTGPTPAHGGARVPLPPGANMAMGHRPVDDGYHISGRGWKAIIISLILGIITLVLAPLLVEYLAKELFPEDGAPGNGSGSRPDSGIHDASGPVPDPGPIMLHHLPTA
ncbi:serine/threonine protein kinase [Murinocardiopsis flavida]|uniref:non-specific serine/threonine protein kinase n=1 Tax=Murinocardiopsis flavida TaxID=645275 RepID=A0A2P8DHA5_9ACTN|nr:serine/threonine-protein kinase [Murinocardiopsis flavida]PSK96583.1 serine/threonine protein kinase [Murinocardiopsis flavida]